MKYLYKILLLLILINTAWAGSVEKISLEECVEMGIENSETLHSALMKVEEAEAKVSEQSATRLPSLSFSGAYSRLSDERDFSISLETAMGSQEMTIMEEVLNRYQMGLSLKQPVFTGFRLSNAVRMAEYQAKAADQNLEIQKNELAYLIKTAYWNYYRAIEFKKLVDENIAQVEAHLKDVKNMFEQGLATKNEVLKVEVQLSNTKFLQIESETAVRQANIFLSSIIGLPLDTEIELTTEISETQEELEKIDKLVEEALGNRSEVKAAELIVKSGKSGVKVAQAGYYPQIFLQGNYNYSRPNQRIQPIKDEFEDSWDVTLGISYEFWNWGKTGDQVKQAQAKVAQMEDQVQQIEESIELEVNQVYLNLIKAKEQIDVAEQGIVQAEENYRVTKDKFKAGMALNSDLLDAEVALLQAKTNKTKALVNYELERAKLEKAMGKN